MTGMMEFTTFMLTAFANFLGREPVMYLFGAIILMFLCKGIKILMN